MTHEDHVSLIRKGGVEEGSVWADLGSGDGAFTLALRDIAGSECEIYSVDQDAQRLKTQEKNFHEQFPDTHITFIQADFTESIHLPPLDGVIMANSLHFVETKKPVLEFVQTYLKPNGRLILIEYNVDVGNQWVPYPVSFASLPEVLRPSGFSNPELIGRISSLFLKEIYSTLSFKQ